MSYAEGAGFGERHLEFRVDVSPHPPRPWDILLQSSPNPRAPSLAEAVVETLTSEEATRFAAHLRPLVEGGQGTFAVAVAYLWAVKR